MVMFSIICMDFFRLEAAQAGYLMSAFGVLLMVSEGRAPGWAGARGVPQCPGSALLTCFSQPSPQAPLPPRAPMPAVPRPCPPRVPLSALSRRDREGPAQRWVWEGEAGLRVRPRGGGGGLQGQVGPQKGATRRPRRSCPPPTPRAQGALCGWERGLRVKPQGQAAPGALGPGANCKDHEADCAQGGHGSGLSSEDADELKEVF